MENIASFNEVTKLSWFHKRCRQLVFSILNKIEDNLEITELDGAFDLTSDAKLKDAQSNTYLFGPNVGQAEGTIHAKIIIRDLTVYADFLKGGSIGVAETFIDERWSSPDLTKVIQLFAKAQKVTDTLESKMTLVTKCKNALFHYFNRNNQQGSKKNILAHYDLGNDLYTRFLDSDMMYSSAIYPNKEATLEQAQQHKLSLICQRLALKSTDHLLEIGTGWGGLAIYAATHYGCQVTTTTISDAQHDYAKARIEALGLTDKITLLKKDYRELTGSYDKLVSIEMIEAVGYKYMDSFFTQCHERLKPNGKMLLQAITIADQRFDSYLNNVDFIQRYIFPGGFLPSITLMNEKLRDNTDMVMEELHDIGLDYAQTLADWRTNFNHSWESLKQFGFDEKFKRLWLYYFAYCEGAFLERSISTVHFIARK